MTEAQHNLPTDPVRVRAFAAFFKRYMSVSSLVTAALPIPVTFLKLIPTYGFQTGVLSVYTSLFCFLTLAFIFYSRHGLARRMFAYYFEQRESLVASENLPSRTSDDFMSQAEDNPHWRMERHDRGFNRMMERHERRFKREDIEWEASWRERGIGRLPLLLIVLSLIAVVAYTWTLIASATQLPLEPPSSESQTFGYLLQSADPLDVPPILQIVLLVEYIAIFLAAEAAFVLMAIKEYLQDYLRLEDIDLIGE
jgi:hypothetical protein